MRLDFAMRSMNILFNTKEYFSTLDFVGARIDPQGGQVYCHESLYGQTKQA